MAECREWVESGHSTILNVHESFRRAYPLAMSTKHIRSASDLVRFGAGLKVECGACGNARTFGGFDLIRTFNTDKFDDIQRRSKCSRCGHREARLTILTPPARRD